MTNKIKNYLNKINTPFTRYLIVGGINTVFGTSVMFIFYNFFNFGYWPSSAANYIFGSILSYFLNKYFTFKSKAKSKAQILRFIVNISICYFIGYGLAQPIAERLLASTQASQGVKDNISMIIGMGLYVVLNYFGQRFFVFKDKD